MCSNEAGSTLMSNAVPLWPALLLAVAVAAPGTAQNAGAENPGAESASCADAASLTVPEVTRGGLARGPHTFIADGVRFWYCVGGREAAGRAPVVFVHGGPGQGSQHFATLTGPTLEPSLRMVYFDQRGLTVRDGGVRRLKNR